MTWSWKIFGGVSFIPLSSNSLGHLLALMYEIEAGRSQKRIIYKYHCKRRLYGNIKHEHILIMKMNVLATKIFKVMQKYIFCTLYLLFKIIILKVYFGILTKLVIKIKTAGYAEEYLKIASWQRWDLTWAQKDV